MITLSTALLRNLPLIVLSYFIVVHRYALSHVWEYIRADFHCATTLYNALRGKTSSPGFKSYQICLLASQASISSLLGRAATSLLLAIMGSLLYWSKPLILASQAQERQTETVHWYLTWWLLGPFCLLYRLFRLVFLISSWFQECVFMKASVYSVVEKWKQ